MSEKAGSGSRDDGLSGPGEDRSEPPERRTVLEGLGGQWLYTHECRRAKKLIPEYMSLNKKSFWGLILVILYAGWIGSVARLGILAIFRQPVSIVYGPIPMILFAGWIGGVVLLGALVIRRYHRVYRWHWYDLSADGPNGEMDWRQVRYLMNKDALRDFPDRSCCSWRWKDWKPQRCPVKHILIDLLGGAVLVFLSIGTLKLVCDSQDKPEYYAGLESLGILGGGLSVAVGIFTIFYHGRLKARSENRQAWINSIRKEICTLIVNFPSYDAGRSRINSANYKYRYCLSRLELFLNPHERVHRGFMAIVRLMYCADDDYFDKKVLSQLGNNNKLLSRPETYVEWKKLRSYAIRLATVLLKREWEQVKHVK